jgi:hypothetical protein
MPKMSRYLVAEPRVNVDPRISSFGTGFLLIRYFSSSSIGVRTRLSLV